MIFILAFHAHLGHFDPMKTPQTTKPKPASLALDLRRLVDRRRKKLRASGQTR